MIVHTKRVNIHEALGWELYKESLAWRLVDLACAEARDVGAGGLAAIDTGEEEETVHIAIEGEEIVLSVEVPDA